MKKDNISNFILILIFFVGLSLMLYPSFSDYWNSFTQTKAIATYTQEIAKIDNVSYDHIWQAAKEFNSILNQRSNPYILSEEQEETYQTALNVSGSGVMGYVEIPVLGVSLPVYHGTEDEVLQVAIGHLEWTSLPTGGEGTHCVLSGHRGLPSAKLFTDIDRLVVGDIFQLYVLDEILTYEVDQILIVEPDETEALLVEEGKDLCTLVTCTPYGINSHRLLVRGHRVDNLPEEKQIRVMADAMLVEPALVAPVVAAPILLILLIILLWPRPRKR